jgi:hypothetical protein
MARAFGFAHVRRLPAELIERLGDDSPRLLVIPANKHCCRPPENCGSIMRALPRGVERLDEMSLRKLSLESSMSDSSSLVKPQDAVHGWQVRDRQSPPPQPNFPRVLTDFFGAHSASFDGSRVPIITKCPCLRKPAASTLAIITRSQDSNSHAEQGGRIIC